jgi:hypothetical protein
MRNMTTTTETNGVRVRKPNKKRETAPAAPAPKPTKPKALNSEKETRKADFMRFITTHRELKELEEGISEKRVERAKIIEDLVNKYGPGPWDIGDGEIVTFMLHKGRSKDKLPKWTVKQRSEEVEIID